MEIVHIKLGDQLSTKINEMAAKENTTAAEIGKNILTQYLFDDNYKIPLKMDVISEQIEKYESDDSRTLFKKSISKR